MDTGVKDADGFMEKNLTEAHVKAIQVKADEDEVAQKKESILEKLKKCWKGKKKK